MPRRSTSSYILAEARRSSAAFWSLVNSQERAMRLGAGVVCVRSGIVARSGEFLSDDEAQATLRRRRRQLGVTKKNVEP